MLFSAAGPGVFITHHPFLVGNNVRTVGKASCFIQYPIGLHNFQIRRIAEKGIVDLEEIGKGLLRKRRIGADAQNFSVFSLELPVIVVRTGRLQVLKSGGAKVQDVEIDEDILPAQATQLEFSSLRAGKLKVRRLIPYLHCQERSRGQKKQGGQKDY